MNFGVCMHIGIYVQECTRGYKSIQSVFHFYLLSKDLSDEPRAHQQARIASWLDCLVSKLWRSACLCSHSAIIRISVATSGWFFFFNVGARETQVLTFTGTLLTWASPSTLGCDPELLIFYLPSAGVTVMWYHVRLIYLLSPLKLCPKKFLSRAATISLFLFHMLFLTCCWLFKSKTRTIHKPTWIKN